MILLDTHAWLWWVSTPERLGAGASEAIARGMQEDALAISAISAWEVAMLVERGRLRLDRSVDALVRATSALSFLHFVEVDVRIAIASTRLRLPHRDPADRMIVATSQLLDATLVTRDRVLQEFEGVRTVW